MKSFRGLNKVTVKFITGAGLLALIAGMSLSISPQAFAYDCLLDTNNDGNADSNIDTDGGADSGGVNLKLACGALASAGGANSTAVGYSASAAGTQSTALGRSASSAGAQSTAVGYFASAASGSSTALGSLAETDLGGTTSVGYAANFSVAVGANSTALGSFARTGGTNAIAIGADTGDGNLTGANAQGDDSIVIGADARDANFDRAIVIGKNALASEADQIILKSADTFTILGNGNVGLGGSAPQTKLHIQAPIQPVIRLHQDGSNMTFPEQAWDLGGNATNFFLRDNTNSDALPFRIAAGSPTDSLRIMSNGDVGLGTATPMGNLDINSGVDDTVLLLSNASAQWELKSKASTGRLNFKNLTAGGVPFKLGPSAVNALLSVGTMADDLVEVRGELMVEGDVDVTGTLTTGGPTCGGGCDAVFDADYDLPSIEEHAAEMYANSYLPEIGPTVPLAPVNLSEQYGKVINELEKAHIYIAQQELQLGTIRTQQGLEKQMMQIKFDQQNARLERLEALLGQ